MSDNGVDKIVYICYDYGGLDRMTKVCKKKFPTYMILSQKNAEKEYEYTPNDINSYRNNKLSDWIEFMIIHSDELWLLDFADYQEEIKYAKKHNINVVRM